MEYFDELENVDKNYDNVVGLYINHPNKLSYLIYLANQKKENITQLNEEIAYYFDIMVSLVSDYIKGDYKKIPIRTILYLISTISYFVYPKRTFLDQVPGIKIIKKIGLIKLVIHSFKKDLLKYANWKKNHENSIES